MSVYSLDFESSVTGLCPIGAEPRSSTRCCLSEASLARAENKRFGFQLALVLKVQIAHFWLLFGRKQKEARSQCRSLESISTFRERNPAGVFFNTLQNSHKEYLENTVGRVSSRQTRYFLFAKRKYPKKVLFNSLVYLVSRLVSSTLTARAKLASAQTAPRATDGVTPGDSSLSVVTMNCGDTPQ